MKDIKQIAEENGLREYPINNQTPEWRSSDYFYDSNERDRNIYIAAFISGSQYGKEWISVEENLPDTDERVFICLVVDGKIHYTIDRYLKDHWKVIDLVPTAKVTHYMQLFEPPIK